MGLVALTNIKAGDADDVVTIDAGDDVSGLDSDLLDDLKEAGAVAEEDSVEALELKRSMVPANAPDSVQQQKSTVLDSVAALFGTEVADAIRRVDAERAEEAAAEAEAEQEEPTDPENPEE